ncbi:MAG: (E)-4-hydroxy-3-methylbut-2-enyl-diphosphate synthase [Bacteroidia bacterium]|nr:(E)-4-hydroxy-3-methylbut-2-enyl-diphosphate synthase [Bacteroidia bacterium]
MFFLKHLSYKRIKTQEVTIGDLKMGGEYPIRIQSMTTTDTMDTQKTVEQSIRMAESGCELIRITAPSMKEAENLLNIKNELRKRGCDVPLVADIHFTPNAAEVAARIVEKVRVNPGNYADKKRFENIDYTDITYQAELDRIYKKFAPLVRICKEYGTAMRIGTNHGSLSDRIMSRYGDSPLGMVESAWEFIQICEDLNYYNLVVSMKASNPQVMVQAYRLLMDRMLKHDRIYPLHLGVTEAGEGEDGRIKSALGIATLLMDGIGDTIRVSLTEDPEYESPVAMFLRDYFVKNAPQLPEKPYEKVFEAKNTLPFHPYEFERRKTRQVGNTGNHEVPRVVGDIRHAFSSPSDLKEMGYDYSSLLDKYNFQDIAADFVYLGSGLPAYEMPGGLKMIYDAETWRLLKEDNRSFPLFASCKAFTEAKEHHPSMNFVTVMPEEVEALSPDLLWDKVVFVLQSDESIPVYAFRTMIYQLTEKGFQNPVLVSVSSGKDFAFYSDQHFPEFVRINKEAEVQLSVSSDLSSLLVDGLIDGVWIQKASHLLLRTVFGCLQMSRMRITKTEYISCPSCGRTLFDLMETTAKIRARTEHLKGVKIGIMGCIVNGPGEMADADYGYVGVGPDKIALYRGKEVVMKAVKTAEAVDKLIDIIKEDGRWVELQEN